MDALVPGIGRSYQSPEALTQDLSWKSEAVLPNTNVQEGVPSAGTQSPFVVSQHPGPETLNLPSCSVSASPGHISSGSMRTTATSSQAGITMFEDLHSILFKT